MSLHLRQTVARQGYTYSDAKAPSLGTQLKLQLRSLPVQHGIEQIRTNSDPTLMLLSLMGDSIQIEQMVRTNSDPTLKASVTDVDMSLCGS